LLAQQLVAQYISGDLSEKHWTYEMENLFATSLARIQFDAWAIVKGEGYKEDGYKKVFPLDSSMDVCGIFKFRTSGYVNIALWPMIMVLLMTPIWMFLSLEVSKLVSYSKQFGNWFKMSVKNLASRKSKSSAPQGGIVVQASQPVAQPEVRSEEEGGERTSSASGLDLESAGITSAPGGNGTGGSVNAESHPSSQDGADARIEIPTVEGSSRTVQPLSEDSQQAGTSSRLAGKRKAMEEDPNIATGQTPAAPVSSAIVPPDAESEPDDGPDEFGDSIVIGFVLRWVGRGLRWIWRKVTCSPSE
jgi:hypothetical protein